MILSAVLSIIFLIINPTLFLILKRLEINIQKFHFWVMVTTGLSWISSLIGLLTNPDQTLSLYWDVQSQLLPGTVFTLDQVSSTLLLGLNTIIFVIALHQRQTPLQLAWITGLGFLCSLGILADSPFTLLIALTLVEILLVTNFITSPEKNETIRRKLIAVIFRLVSPYLVLYALLLSGFQDPQVRFTDLSPDSGPVLITAGILGVLGWYGLFRKENQESSSLIPKLLSEIIPGSIGLMLIIRGGTLLGNENIEPGAILFFVISVLVLVIVLFLFKASENAWTLGILAIIATSAIYGSLSVSLVWSIVFLIPGYFLRIRDGNTSQQIPFLISGVIGITTLPFFPAWQGVSVLTANLSGFLLAVIFALAAGDLVATRVKDIRPVQNLLKLLNPINLLIFFCLLFTQYIISARMGLLNESVSLADRSIAVWLSSILLVGTIIGGGFIPRLYLPAVDQLPSRLASSSSATLNSGSELIKGLITLLSGLFEGDGGLIWAILFGLLILTLINLGGG